MGWIYVFRDRGYEQGVKIGCDSSADGFTRHQRADSYTPRGIVYEAAWSVDPARYGAASLRSLEETVLHPQLAADLRPLIFPNNGVEWFDATAEQAVGALTALFDRAPDRRCPAVPRCAPWDDLRNPKDVGRGRFRQVLWVYQEHLTGRLKTQRIDDWRAPREVRRTYSRNGFRAVAAFIAADPTGPEGNWTVQAAWEAALERFGRGEPHAPYGWTAPGTSVEDLAQLYAEQGLKPVDPAGAPPDGVKVAYNVAQACAF